jgi:hypothetical protein
MRGIHAEARVPAGGGPNPNWAGPALNGKSGGEKIQAVPSRGRLEVDMKAIILFIALCAVAAVPAAAKSIKPLADWSCSEFNGTEDIIKPKLIYWATGVEKGGKAKHAVIDIVETDKVIPFVVENCQKLPRSTFLHALTSAWKQVERAVADVEKKL